MRTPTLVLLATLVAPLWGQTTPPESEEPGGQPILFDGGYEWRVQGKRGWQGVEALFRIPLNLGRAGTEHRFLRAHQIGVLGRYERAYGETPNAERVGLAGTYTFGAETPLTPDGGGFHDLRAWGFPFQRSSGVSFAATFGLGWMHSRGTQEDETSPGNPDMQEAFRVEHDVHLSFIAVGIRGHVALNANLRDGPGADWEAGAWITAGYGLLPVGLSLGVLHLGTERAGGTGFSLRVSAHL